MRYQHPISWKGKQCGWRWIGRSLSTTLCTYPLKQKQNWDINEREKGTGDFIWRRFFRAKILRSRERSIYFVALGKMHRLSAEEYKLQQAAIRKAEQVTLKHLIWALRIWNLMKRCCNRPEYLPEKKSSGEHEKTKRSYSKISLPTIIYDMHVWNPDETLLQ